MYSNNTGIPQTTTSTSSSNSQLHNHPLQQQASFNSIIPSFALQHAQQHHHHNNNNNNTNQHHHMHQQNINLHMNLDSNLSSHNLSLGSHTGLINNSVIIPKQELVTHIPEIDKEKEKQARENHCEIERRRRVKMAAYFNELCVMVPTCNTLQRKPDKLTILRMASSHMRNLRGNNAIQSNINNPVTIENNNAYKPSFLTDQELKHLILEAADGFLFVAQCDTGNIIYVSDAIKPVLSYMPNEWSNHSLFDFIHPDDLDKVRDQLSTMENSINNTTGRILDLKTGTVKKEGHPNSMRSHIGSRRSFICRVKLGLHLQQHQQNRQILDPSGVGFWSTTNSRLNRNRNTLQSEIDQQPKTNYSVIHITGYTKVWPPNQSSSNQNNNSNSIYQNNDQSTNNFHLIAIARIQMTSAPTDLINSTNMEFVTRHDQNGIITFVDQKVISLLGYQPSDILKKSIYDFCIPQDQQMLKEQFKIIYETRLNQQPVQITLHLIASSSMQNEIIQFKTNAYAFCNPCNDAFEFIVCTHSCQKYTDNNNSNLNGNNFNLTSQCNNTVLGEPNSTDSLQYSNQYHTLQQNFNNNNNNQLQSINNYSNQQYQYQQNNVLNNSNGSYANYLIMQSKQI